METIGKDIILLLVGMQQSILVQKLNKRILSIDQWGTQSH